jgi:hydroxymethylbilane synthase
VTAKKITIATRGSMLALWQAHYVEEQLEKQGFLAEIQVVKTTGDQIQDRYLHEIGGKGLFVKELEEAMLAGEADIAVHSLKDVPVTLPPAFAIGAVLPRHAVHDVLVIRRKSAIPAGLEIEEGRTLDPEALAKSGPLTVGTSSLRRSALLALYAPKLKCIPVRGNVDTRLRKLGEGSFDAIVLAGASLERLGDKAWTGLQKDDFVICNLDPTYFVPCAAQGALAIEVPKTAELLSESTRWLSQLSCIDTTFCVTVERGILKSLGGDCTMPFGALCRIIEEGGKRIINARAMLLASDGNHATASLLTEWTPEKSPDAVAAQLLSALADQGAADVLKQLQLPVPETLRLH